MAIVRRVQDITEAEKTVEPLQLPLADPLGETIQTKFFNLFSTPDETLDAGIWETEVGRSRWEFTDNGEVIYVLGGAMTVQRDGEDPIEVRAGDLAIFEKGWKGFWTVTEPLSKVYVIFS